MLHRAFGTTGCIKDEELGQGDIAMLFSGWTVPWKGYGALWEVQKRCRGIQNNVESDIDRFNLISKNIERCRGMLSAVEEYRALQRATYITVKGIATL
jgi:hypothetical protein